MSDGAEPVKCVSRVGVFTARRLGVGDWVLTPATMPGGPFIISDRAYRTLFYEDVGLARPVTQPPRT